MNGHPITKIGLLLFRGTKNGSSADIFYNKYDNQGPTLCLCKNEKNNIFAGYSSISWTTLIEALYSSL